MFDNDHGVKFGLYSGLYLGHGAGAMAACGQ